jgi:hypothetical protein
VDFGASWIHGSSEVHPITVLKDALGLTVATTIDESLVFKQCPSESVPDGGCPEVENDLSKEYKDLMAQAKSVARPGQSVWDSLAGTTLSMQNKPS